ncbi:MAG: class I SAM-dependent methyltransferase [Pseudomonadales bacterium]|nr:class I SAM-dependent methyltransferase [Pseudomonadales bacterium]NRA16839.1 methyltransferase [Oceanospirillaceae bacterium]
MNNSSSFELLFGQFPSAGDKALWVLDENPPLNCPAATANIEVISNRYDVVELMQSRGYSARFSDFQFEQLQTHSYSRIFYRISKEKALAHHIINSAQKLLCNEGILTISGAKQEGIKGYIERTGNLYEHLETYKADKQNWAASYRQTGPLTQLLDDKNYTALRLLSGTSENKNPIEFYSKPGVFGWNKIDAGSKLLLEHLEEVYRHRDKPEALLDIGCGYGYLSVCAAKLYQCSVTATDNNAAAITACSYNLQHHQIEHKVVATNCTAAVTEQFDLVLCNPPFHSGFQVENDLTEQFLLAAKQRLRKNAVAVFVVNLHIPLERKAKKLFSGIQTISDDRHFKIVLLSQ